MAKKPEEQCLMIATIPAVIADIARTAPTAITPTGPVAAAKAPAAAKLKVVAEPTPATVPTVDPNTTPLLAVVQTLR